MGTHKRIGLPLGVLVASLGIACGLTCAPVDPPTSKESAARESTESLPLEALPHAPTPLSSGVRPRASLRF